MPKILYVEDNDMVRMSMCRSLRLKLNAAGVGEIEIITAENGQEAIDLIKSIRDELALVLTDLRMPLVNGDKVAEEAIKHEIPVIVLSGTVGDLTENIANQCLGVLLKPPNMNELMELIKDAISKYLPKKQK